MKATRRMAAVIGIMSSLICGTRISAQEVNTGLTLARQVCAVCHTIDKSNDGSPNAAAPPFKTVANIPGMTATALAVALRTSHTTMPNLMLQRDELDGVVAYILSLKDAN